MLVGTSNPPHWLISYLLTLYMQLFEYCLSLLLPAWGFLSALNSDARLRDVEWVLDADRRSETSGPVLDNGPIHL
jgi:hypothetical protein